MLSNHFLGRGMIFLKKFVVETEWIGIGLAKMIGIIIFAIVVYFSVIFQKNCCVFILPGVSTMIIFAKFNFSL